MKNKGLSIIEIVLIIATVLVIAFVGFALYRANTNMVEMQDSTRSNQESMREDESEVPDIESEEDLREAEDSLNDIDFDEQLDSSNLSVQP